MHRPAATPALLGREAELARTGELVARAAAGQGGMLVIEGAAGIGKTRLLREVAAAADHAGLDVLTARAGELEQRFAFGVVRQAIEPVLEGLDAAAREQLLDGVVRPARAAVSGAPETADARLPESQGVLHGLFWLLARLAGDRGLVVVLDDLHWADEGTLRLLSFLVPRLESVPLLVVAAARPWTDPALAALAAEQEVSVLRPRALDEEAVAALVADALQREPEPAFTRACLAASGGNPFLLVELLRALADDAIEPVARQAARVAKISPDNVARSVAGRLARLGPEATAVAQAVAVLGESAGLAAAAELAGLDERAAASAADALARAGILSGELPPAFAHPLLRTAVDGDLAPGERQRLHAAAAALLTAHGAPAERIALHLLETEPRRDPATATLLATAGRSAARRGSPATAVALLQRALAEPPAPADRLGVVFDLGLAESGTGAAAAEEHLREVVDHSTDPVLRARALRQLTWVTGPSSEEQRELIPIYAGVARAVEPVDRELALSLLAARIGALFLNPSVQPRFEDEVDAYADLAGDTPGESALLAWLARKTMLVGGTAAQVTEIAQRAARNATVSDADAGPGPAWLLHLILSLIAVERFELAEALLGPAFAVARERGSASAFASACAQRAMVRHGAGDLRGCEADARAALETQGLDNYYSFQPLMPLTESLADQGKWDEAERELAARGVDGPLPAARPYTALLMARGRLRAEAGRTAAAREDLTEALQRLDLARARGTIGLDGRLEAALVLHATGATDEAQRIAGDALSAARAWGGARAVGGALRVAGLLRGGDEGLELLREAAETLAQSPARLWRARALVDYGAALRRANRRRDCRAPLRDGLALAEECGATPLAERARRELAASGGRLPPRTGGRFDELTPSELRVAGLAAEGLSNPEIAQRLFVTIKTVEMHLSNAYRKLSISSRRDLPAALAPR